jgi:hypothetical protein
MNESPVPQAFQAALDVLIAQARKDKAVLAAILCGSLSHDTVWERSDIDLVFVTVDDKKITTSDLPLYADGVNVHAIMIPRAEFRKAVEGSLQNSFMHSFLAKGRLLYTHDQTIAAMCRRLETLGGRDLAIAKLNAATGVLPALYKARKWFVTRKDYAYTSLWLLSAAEALARLEVISAGLLADRETLPRALTLNPSLFKTVYTDLLRSGTERAPVEKALQTMEETMAARARAVFKPIIDYLEEVGDVRSSRDLEDYFKKNFGVPHVTTACEYLSDLGMIGKASTSVQLTRISSISLEELAFFYMEPDGGR